MLVSIKQLGNKRNVFGLNHLMLLTMCILALVSASYVFSVQDMLTKKAPKVFFASPDSLSFTPLVLALPDFLILLLALTLRV